MTRLILFRKPQFCSSSPELASVLTSMSSTMCLYAHLGVGMLSIDVIMYAHTHTYKYIHTYFNFMYMHTYTHISAAYFVCISACVYL